MSKKNTNPTVVLIIAHDFGNKRNHRYFTLLYDVMQTYQKSIRIVAFRLSDFTFTFHFHALEKEMATYSSILAWRIPGTGEPGGLLSMESHRVGHNWSDLAVAAFFPLIQAAHNIEQSSLCYTVGPCWLSILNTAVCTCQSQTQAFKGILNIT